MIEGEVRLPCQPYFRRLICQAQVPPTQTSLQDTATRTGSLKTQLPNTQSQSPISRNSIFRENQRPIPAGGVILNTELISLDN